MSIWRKWVIGCLILLTACGGGDIELPIPLPSDANTPVPVPTEAPPTAVPTDVPITEDASGYARAFYRAWEGFDFIGMYSLLSPQSQALVDGNSFVQRYQEMMETAVVQQIHAQPLSIVQEHDQAEFSVRVTWETAVVGDIVRDHLVRLVFNNGRWGNVDGALANVSSLHHGAVNLLGIAYEACDMLSNLANRFPYIGAIGKENGRFWVV